MTNEVRMTDITNTDDRHRGTSVYRPLNDETELLVAEALKTATGMPPEGQAQCDCTSLYIEYYGSSGDDDPLPTDRHMVHVDRSHHRKGCAAGEDKRRRELECEMYFLMERFTRHDRQYRCQSLERPHQDRLGDKTEVSK